MTAANISFVQSLYGAFGRGEIGLVVAGMAPDVDWQVTGRKEDYPCFGAWKGQKGVGEFFRLVGENEDAIEFTPRDFYTAGEKVFVLGHYTWKIRKTGKHVITDWLHVFTLKGGKVSAFREFTDTAQFAQAYRI